MYKLVRTIEEQTELAIKSCKEAVPQREYVGLLVMLTGNTTPEGHHEATWYVAAWFHSHDESLRWWESQRDPARVYDARGYLQMSK